MATWNPEKVTHEGIEPTFQAPDATTSGSQILTNGHKAMLIARNAANTAMTLTFLTQKTVDGEDADDKAIQIPANGGSGIEERLIGPFDPDDYENNDGEVRFTASRTTNITIAAIYA